MERRDEIRIDLAMSGVHPSQQRWSREVLCVRLSATTQIGAAHQGSAAFSRGEMMGEIGVILLFTLLFFLLLGDG